MAQQKKKAASAFMAPVEVSKELEAVIGKGPMPRTKVIKELWAYIKKHKCQDTKNKRNIIPDEKLAKVFGSSSPIDMFQMTKKVSKHLR
jgi:chromatin remodeling complex protein RSC6